MKLDADLAARFARIALGHVAREYPHKLDHVLLGDEDALPPRELHPIFFGSFDWHSCVHGWWTLLTLRRLFPRDGRGAGDRRRWPTRRSPPTRSRASSPISTGRQRRVRAALRLGVAALSPSRSVAPRRPRLGSDARAAGPRLRRAAQRLSRQADLSDPRRHAFQHRLRADPVARLGRALRPRPGRDDPRLGASTGSAPTATARRGSRAATNSCRPR